MNKRFNNFYCKLFFVIIPFFNEIPIFMSVFTPCLKIGLILSLAYIVYDLFTSKNILKMNYITLIAIFVGAVTIGTLLNYKSDMFKMNIIEIFYMIAAMLVLFMVPKDSSKEQCYKELRSIGYILSGLISVVSLISLVMYFSKIGFSYTYNDYEYHLGIYDGRLVGLYRNSIYPTAAIGLFVSILQLMLNKTYFLVKKSWANKLLVLGAAINFLTVSLQNSKGLIIGLCIATAFAAFICAFKAQTGCPLVLQKLQQKQRFLVAVPFAGAVLGVCYGLLWALRKLSSLIIFAVGFLFDSSKEETFEEAQAFFERQDVSGKYGALTGRPYIWSSGLKYFKDSPIVGYGPKTFANIIKPYEGSTEQITHFHNIFIHVLVSGGIVGFVAFFTMFLLIGIRIIKALMEEYNRKDYAVVLSLSTLLVFVLVINLADTTILFATKHSGYLFFILLGYLLALIEDKSEYKLDVPFKKLAKLLSKKGEKA